jgi:hypothetical protein
MEDQKDLFGSGAEFNRRVDKAVLRRIELCDGFAGVHHRQRGR